jgi:ribosome-associated toxin RatA of RatAB toxin-antitoxin module
LLAREIVVVSSVDPSGASGRARAAVWIAAPPATVFAWMTDCAKALSFVPHLKTCRVTETAADRLSELVAHEVDYSWFLPRTRYVFRARYQPPTRVDFQEVSGDLEINQGSWQLTASPDAAHTLVTYEVRLKPRMFVPSWLVRRGLRKDLPELLAALRTVSESAAPPR